MEFFCWLFFLCIQNYSELNASWDFSPTFPPDSQFKMMNDSCNLLISSYLELDSFFSICLFINFVRGWLSLNIQLLPYNFIATFLAVKLTIILLLFVNCHKHNNLMNVHDHSMYFASWSSIFNCLLNHAVMDRLTSFSEAYLQF